MEADFSGYATKAGLKCSDGLVIMPDAFKHQDTMQVPLVWQHGHTDVENVLGHAILENREDGVYTYGYFNQTTKAHAARELLQHGDIKMMSIWANDLIKRADRVLHGAIREVSLVLSGANPGAVIESVTIQHGDMETELEDEAIIYTGLEIELMHSDADADEDEESDSEESDDEGTNDEDDSDDSIEHADMADGTTADGPDEETIADIVDSMSEKQQDVLHYLVGEAISAAESGSTDTEDSTTLQQDHLGQQDTKEKEGDDMGRNVFEDDKTKEGEKTVLSHSDIAGIVADATARGSLKNAVDAYALEHGITDISTLFPEDVATSNTPEWFGRRTDWVDKVLGGVRKSPFSRIKTLMADITEDEARAKGYITGSLKKVEFFSVAKRVTTPTTIYKKQQLDRDDMIDITDFDVVAWLKGEMRLMLDEELARAILLGDGRDPSSDDKINDQCIRPIATDHELYTTKVTVNIDDASSSVQEIIDAIVLNRRYLRGTGLPTMYTTETYIAKFLLLKDSLGRRIYNNLEEVASELRVTEIVAVEVMEEEADLVAVLVNPMDYVVGATKGGEVSMFDDFDIDYNRQKYLIETRCSGALTKLKAAMVVEKTASTNVLVVPAMPDFDTETGVLTIVNQTGVVYKNGATVVNAAGSPYAAIASGASVTIDATPASGYYFQTSEEDSWTFTRD